MKRSLHLMIAVLVFISCNKQVVVDEPTEDKWNGYRKYFKAGEQIHILWAGKNINIGTVTYGIDENANFYATYDCSLSGWLISETHMYAGDKADMPLNKPGAPKIGLFPHSGYHHPRAGTFTYSVPLSQLPPCDSPGFVVAAHCVAHSPSGQTETAWAEGDYTFSDKGWGWYDAFYYTPPPTSSTILYGTSYHFDSLKLYHINVISGEAELILTEFVGNASGKYDGAAFDQESGFFLFTNYNTGELWVNNLQGDDPSFSAGTLSGISASGTFYNGAYYYVNEGMNTINKATFTNDWAIEGDTILDILPGLITVNDIAMSPSGDYLYILGHYCSNEAELIRWNVSSHSFFTLSVSINNDTQIAFGSDGMLYAIAPLFESGGSSYVYLINVTAGTLTPIDEEVIIILDDPFSDLSKGPVM